MGLVLRKRTGLENHEYLAGEYTKVDEIAKGKDTEPVIKEQSLFSQIWVTWFRSGYLVILLLLPASSRTIIRLFNFSVR